MRREAADPRVGERRGGASLGKRRDPDRPVTPAMLLKKMKQIAVQLRFLNELAELAQWPLG